MNKEEHKNDKFWLHKEQGTMMTCVYCTTVYPDLYTKDCPICKGKKNFFRPARMMDKESSQTYMFEILSSFFKELPSIHFPLSSEEITKEEAIKIKNIALGILNDLILYNFDFKDAIVNLIRNIEEDPFKK